MKNVKGVCSSKANKKPSSRYDLSNFYVPFDLKTISNCEQILANATMKPDSIPLEKGSTIIN